MAAPARPQVPASSAPDHARAPGRDALVRPGLGWGAAAFLAIAVLAAATASSAAVAQPVPGADLAVTVDGPSTVVAGTELTTTTTVVNDGPDDATDIVISHEIRGDLALVSATTQAGAACPEGVCSVPTLAAGGSVVVTVVMAVPASAPDASGVEVGAKAVSATPDPHDDNDEARASATIEAEADLWLFWLDFVDDFITPGWETIYVVEFSNEGPSNASDVIMTVELPLGLDLTDEPLDDEGGDCTGDGETPVVVTCVVGLLEDDDYVRMEFYVAIAPSVTEGPFLSALLSSPTQDPDVSNNRATSGPAELWPDIDLDMAVDGPARAQPQEAVSAVFTLSNEGSSDLTEVLLELPQPTGLTFTSATPESGGTCNLEVICDLDRVPGDGSVRILVEAVVDGDAVGTITSTATATSPNNNSWSDPHATWEVVVAPAAPTPTPTPTPPSTPSPTSSPAPTEAAEPAPSPSPSPAGPAPTTEPTDPPTGRRAVAPARAATPPDLPALPTTGAATDRLATIGLLLILIGLALRSTRRARRPR